MSDASANIISGPATVKLADAAIGHTQGGVKATITPQNRARVVDMYGSSALYMIHTGDEVRVTVPFAQYDAANLAEVYNPGVDGTAGSAGYLGIGRSAGFVYTTQDMKIVPRLASQAAKLAQFYKTTPVGAVEQMWDNASTDRILSTEFAALVDETQDDGELIGKLALSV